MAASARRRSRRVPPPAPTCSSPVARCSVQPIAPGASRNYGPLPPAPAAPGPPEPAEDSGRSRLRLAASAGYPARSLGSRSTTEHHGLDALRQEEGHARWAVDQVRVLRRHAVQEGVRTEE